MYVIAIFALPAKILLLSDFFLFPSSLEILGALSVAALVVLHHPYSMFPTVFCPAQLRQLCTPSTLFLPPISRPCHSIHGHLCTISTPRIPADTTHVANHQPSPLAPQNRARKGRIRCPIIQPYPYRRHPLSAPDPLLRSPLPLRVHFQESS